MSDDNEEPNAKTPNALESLTLADAKRLIHAEISADDPEIRASFLRRYGGEVERFSELMARALIAWRDLAVSVEKHEKIVFVANIVYCAIVLHILSMRLFLSGHMVAAGSLSRQVTEAIATALLCSGKDLPVLDRFIEDRYSTKRAVRDVLRNRERLNLRKEALAALAESEEFYHLYSHMSKMTVASVTSFSENGFYIGASFDNGKTAAYDKEVGTRMSLGMVFPNFVEAVMFNIQKW